MAEGHDPYDDPNLKGMTRYFNNKTVKGRANVSLATLILLFGGCGYLYMKLGNKEKEK